jgi:hypothetical protein
MGTSSPKRRRGAPPGNQNARKHGFYASQKPDNDLTDVGPLTINFQSEINLIRQSMQRVLALGEPQTYHEAVDYLRALGLAATALTRLARTHRYLYPTPDPRDELTNTITEALKEIGEMVEAGEIPRSRPKRLPHPRPRFRIRLRGSPTDLP